MIVKKAVTALAVIVLGVGLTVSSAGAKKCPKLCKDTIAACVTALGNPDPSVCDALSKKAKKGCKKGIKKDAKFDKKGCKGIIVGDCKASTATDTCSPSAAFLDSDVVE